MHLHERLDKIFNNGNLWKHRTLRTVFDPYSAEWNETNIETKINILRKIIADGENLEFVIAEYKHFYKKELNKSHVSDDNCNGLVRLIEHLLDKTSGLPSKQGDYAPLLLFSSNCFPAMSPAGDVAFLHTFNFSIQLPISTLSYYSQIENKQ